MTAIFASAYRQLTASERSFVDAAVREIEIQAQKAQVRISSVLNGQSIPLHIVQASRGMLEKPLVNAAINERITAIAAEQELTAQRLVKELHSIATANIGNYLDYDADGVPYFTLASCTPEELAPIKSLEIESNGDAMQRATKVKMKITFHDKMPAVKMLGEYIGMFGVDNPHYVAEQARNAPAIPAEATQEQAADAYAALIGG